MPSIDMSRYLSSSFKRTAWFLLKFFGPFALWIFLSRDFGMEKATITDDTFAFYGGVKFYLDNLREGVYPWWNPFVLWGIPNEINIRQIGEYNPLLFAILILNQLGCRFYHSFFIVVLAYFFLGLVGFYCLVKISLKNSLISYVAFLMVMFSSIGLSIFNQITLLLIYVPCVWFFYFLFRWAHTWEKRFFFGMVYCLMIITTTYLPFYFLTVFMLFLIFFSVLYPRGIPQFFLGLLQFFKIHKLSFAIGILAILIALIPPFVTYLATHQGDIAVQTRHSQDDETFTKGVVMEYEELKGGGISDRMSFGDLFTDLKDVPYTNDGFVYVPIFTFCILLVSIGTTFNRKIVMLMVWWGVLFLIALADVSPVHRFLFDHIFYFKLFRNLYFFLPFLILIGVALVAEELRLFFEQRGKGRSEKYILVGIVTIIHLLFSIFLFKQENIIISSFITLGGSFLFFLLVSLGWGQTRSVVLTLSLLGLILLQPVEVFSSYSRHATQYDFPVIRDGIQREHTKPSFSFTRPEYSQGYHSDNAKKNPNHLFNWYILTSQDSPGFVAYRYGYPTRWSYYLYENMEEEILRAYVKNKFILYDAVRWSAETDLEGLKDALRAPKNVALLFGEKFPESEGSSEENSWVSPNSSIVSGNTEMFSVKDFNVNSLTLKTNFKTKKFLVYNDSYHRGWQAFIDGKKVPLYRANLAFKGLWVPAGERIVRFQYTPSAGQYLSPFTFAFFYLFFGYTLFLLVCSSKQVKAI